MVFHKVIKNKAYFKRYQVKFRRRREGKTDYHARRRLITQDKNKYLTPKYRLVVRFTNTSVIVQVAFSEVDGDKILTSAYSNELPRYGLKVGLKNYAAAYCTGLLAARRLLQKLGMDSIYEGNTEVDGEIHTSESYGSVKPKLHYLPEVDDERLPFRAFLDVGIRATSTGARVFGALKGASDGGLDIPHSNKRFPGYDREEKTFDADAHRARIFGGHVGEYMDYMQEEDDDKFKAHFSKYIAAGLSSDNLEDMYAKVHAAIRADPSAAAKKQQEPNKKYQNPAKRSLKQFRNRILQKKAARIRALTGQA